MIHTRLVAAISLLATWLTCLTTAVAADHPTWAELDTLFGQQWDSADTVAFVSKYQLSRFHKFDEGSFHAKDASFAILFKRYTIECIKLQVTKQTWGDSNWAPYPLPLPFGLAATNTVEQMTAKYGVTNAGPGKWLVGEYKVYPIFLRSTNGIDSLYIWNTNINVGPFPLLPDEIPQRPNAPAELPNPPAFFPEKKKTTAEEKVSPLQKPPPFAYGHYTVINCRRVEGAGRRPVSYSMHEVTVINGKTLEAPLKIHLKYVDNFDIPGNGELVLSGYFTKVEVGSPSWAPDAPEREYMETGPLMFGLLDYFVATGVRAPGAERERFEREVVSKRKERVAKHAVEHGTQPTVSVTNRTSK